MNAADPDRSAAPAAAPPAGRSTSPDSATAPSPPLDDSRRSERLRYAAYGMLIVLACSVMTGRIARVESSSGRTPLLSANDRSRWAAIRALVDHGTFALDDVVLRSDVAPRPPGPDAAPWPYRAGPPAHRDRDWYSIDMVRHRGPDGREHYYSSKPPLLNILLAGPYWLFRQVTGATLAEQPFYVIRSLLFALNVVPFGLLILLVVRWVERHGRADWGKLFTVATAAFGTLLTPFASTLNNHSFAALAVAAALTCVDRVLNDEPPEEPDASGRWYLGAGLAAALAAVCELPALSLVAAVLLALGWRRPRRTVVWAVPPVVVVAALAFYANYAAHGSWRPPYAHRHDGPIVASVARTPAPSETSNDNDDRPAAETPLNAEQRQAVERAIGRTTLPALPPLAAPSSRSSDWEWIPTADPRRFVLWDATTQRRWAVRIADHSIDAHAWDNWYEYEGTYWTDEGKTGVDRGEPSRLTYAFHAIAGHHGLVSLTPVWLLSLLGAAQWLRGGRGWPRRFAFGASAITLVVLAFYLARPLVDRNYGGVSCGFRWMLWLVPLWLAALSPGADLVGRSPWGRRIAWALLAVGAFSAAYSADNPWSHPWLFDYWSHLGWIAY